MVCLFARGASRAGSRRRWHCSPQSSAGLPTGSIPPISKEAKTLLDELDSAGDCRGEVSKHNSAAARAYSEVTLRSHASMAEVCFLPTRPPLAVVRDAS